MKDIKIRPHGQEIILTTDRGIVRGIIVDRLISKEDIISYSILPAKYKRHCKRISTEVFDSVEECATYYKQKLHKDDCKAS